MIKTIAHLADIHIRKLHRFVEYRQVFKTLYKQLKKVKTIYVALDEDARQDAIKLSKFLMDYGISTYLLNMKDKDPSELGFTKFWELLNTTQQSKFSDIIKGRLYG